jgi:hypothetical protein
MFMVQVKNNTVEPDDPPYVAPLYKLAMAGGSGRWAAEVADTPFGIYDSFMGLGVLAP